MMDNLTFITLLTRLRRKTELCVDQNPYKRIWRLTLIHDLRKGLSKIHRARKNGDIKTVKDYENFMKKYFPIRFLESDCKGHLPRKKETVMINPTFERDAPNDY